MTVHILNVCIVYMCMYTLYAGILWCTIYCILYTPSCACVGLFMGCRRKDIRQGLQHMLTELVQPAVGLSVPGFK